MLQVLHRAGVPTIERPARAPDRVRPSAPPARRPPWPRRAVVLTAVLAVAAVGGFAGAVTQWLDAGDAATNDQITVLTQQRDALSADNDELAATVARLAGERQQAAEDLAATSEALAAAQADLEARSIDLAQATSNLDRAWAELTAVRADASATVSELAAARDRVAALSASVAALQDSIADVTRERDSLAAMFPIAVDTSLAGVDVTGSYTAEWLTAYNSGLADVVLPAQVSVGRTPEGWLRVSIPGVIEAGLLGADGALVTVVDTADVVAPVDGTPRLARVVVTIHAAETMTSTDGTTTVTDLGLTVAISTPTVGSVPAGVALFGARLTPVA